MGGVLKICSTDTNIPSPSSGCNKSPICLSVIESTVYSAFLEEYLYLSQSLGHWMIGGCPLLPILNIKSECVLE